MFHVTIVAIRLGVLLCYEQHQNRSFEGVVCFMLVSSRFVWGCCRPCFKTKTVGAYRIRPSWRRGCMFDGGDVFADIM